MDRRPSGYDPSLAETVAQTTPVQSSSSGISHVSSHTEDEGRFIPGTLLGGRYRIIGLLGRGGMGEVYRATDLTLGQSVALKFLPHEAANDQRLLERFAGEVRVARQVSHPNVCRVYDIGELDGTPFISMEYVDGEDLASLLHRIGRLPADKAMETARKICAGLAAAHDRGVIHRDLKPKNIMMNKRGEVLIMDFGLAAIADQLEGAEARNGTPAYMSPEQLKGAEVTARSDIYALGLVLYELFTGKRPYDAKNVAQLIELQESSQPMSMTSLAADVDPGVERAIRRCLDPDPQRRPSSALAVSAALPGGDALSAALAAGEMPSPELVAAADEAEGLARQYLLPCLVLTLACIFAAPLIRQHAYTLPRGSLDMPPDVLAEKGREISSSLGYSRRPADTDVTLVHRYPLIGYLQGKPRPRRWDEWLASEAPIMAEYRESLSSLDADPYGMVTMENPPLTQPGMVNMRIDGHGVLRIFDAIPYNNTPAASPVDAETVFRLAGLDLKNFKEVPPAFVPANPADRLAEWKGPHPKIPETELTVRATWWKGRVTHVGVRFPWDFTPTAAQSFLMKVRNVTGIVAIGAGVFFAIVFARRNWQRDRVDKRGAAWLALFRLGLSIVVWIGTVHPEPADGMVPFLWASAANWVFAAAIFWVLYLALEPAVRANWPHSLVAWSRVVAGQWKDPLVHSRILIGASVGGGLWIALEMFQLVAGPKDYLRVGISLRQLLGTRQWIASYASVIDESLLVGLAGFFMVFGMRWLFRKDLFAAAASAVAFTLMNSDIASEGTWEGALILGAVYIVLYGSLLWVLLRLGLVTMISAVFFLNGVNHICLGTDWKTWYTSAGIATAFVLVSIAVVAFYHASRVRSVLGTSSVA